MEEAATAARTRLLLALVVVWRDATLFRENVEYMVLQHHVAGYPFTTRSATYRPHAIACLWLVNGLWFVAPVVSAVWAWGEVRAVAGV